MDKKDDFTKDPHWGKGGRYIVVDGKRVPAPPIEETAAPAGEDIPAQIGERSDNAQPGVQIDAQGLGPITDNAKPAADADPKKTVKEKYRA